MSKKQRLALLVTGSVAAIKTLPLVGSLRKNGFDVTVLLTRAPEQWNWVPLDAVRKASRHDVVLDNAERSAKTDAYLSSVILIAPATADFICQLAHASSETAHMILEAQRRGSKIMLAPAMNYKMWEHPAVQRNCEALAAAGVIIFGPVKGSLACGDKGFGRMMDVAKIADGVRAAVDEKRHASLRAYEKAKTKSRPAALPKKSKGRILVALGGGNIDWSKIEKLVADIKKTGAEATYVIDQTWVGYREALERLTQQTVVADFFQVPGFDGMEHIRLPEEADVVFYPFLDAALAETMAEGRADTLFLSVYLASKAPKVTTPSCMQELPPSLSFLLRRDGLDVISDLSKLARRKR
ncbi:MAG: flavoprotein [Bdellovibrionales bacterium]